MQKIKLADHTSKNQEGVKAANKRELLQAFLQQIKEIAEKRAVISKCLREIVEKIESNNNNNNSGSDAPGGQAIKMLNDDVLTAKLASEIEYFATIEDLSDDEKSILTDLMSVATLLTAEDAIANPLQKAREVLRTAEELKITAIGKGFDIDEGIYAKQIAIFSDNGKKSNFTFKDTVQAAKNLTKKSTNLKF